MNKLSLKKGFVVLTIAAFLVGGFFVASVAHAADPTLNVYQTTLGSPSGNPEGNVYITGSDVPFLTARDAAIAGTLTSRTTYTPVESSIWGTSGAFGGELYMFSVIKNIPVGSLLGITKSGVYKDMSTPNWTPGFTSYTTYFPMIAYTHTTSTTAFGYLTKFDCDATVCTFVTGSALGEDYSGSSPNGSANTPPTDISQTIGFQFKQTINAKIITGDYTLIGPITLRGYQQGTGYTPGNNVQVVDLGTPENISTVPNLTTVYVDPSYTTTSCGSHECYYDAFPTIKDGITAVATGGTVNVAAGTYDEQVVIDGKNLTLQGAGDTTIIRPSGPSKLTTLYTYPAGTFWVGTKLASVILIKGSTNVTVKDIKVDGANVISLPSGAQRITGILYGESSGLIDNATVATIRTSDNAQRTYGIDLSATTGTHNVEVKNSHITNWLRNGIQAMGANLTANIHDNTLVGPGDVYVGATVPNGILFIHGVGGNATHNTISGMHTTASTSRSAGILFYDPVTAGIVVENNNISDVDDGVDVSTNANDVIIRNNNLHDNAETGIHLETGAVNNTIINNTIINNGVAGIRLNGPDTGDIPGTGNVAHGNIITSNGVGVMNLDAGHAFDATNNWWGSATPVFDSIISGDVSHDPWYTNAGMTTLNVYANIAPTSSTDGQADLPAGVTTVILDDTHSLDVSGGINTVSGGNVVIGGVTEDLSSYTSGDLSGINLDTAQTVGDKQVTIDQAVTLQSGTNGDPILLTNSNVSDVVVSIPDGTTILAPSGWDGTIDPPTAGSSSGETAPSGFSVGSTVIDVGSPNVVLLFDQAVKITLTGVTGTVGYKPAGSDTWKTITTQCTSADVPGISFPGECSIPDGQGNTIIWTYHFTSFGELNVVVPPTSGGGGGHPAPLPTPATPAVPANIVTPDGCSAGNKFSTTTGRNCNAATPAGQVLGASTGPISGCGNRTTGFSVATGESCIGNSTGQVLGAANFNFTKLMKNNSKGTEVIELQKFLTTLGYTLVADGKFGPKTKGAVIKFQIANGLKGDGIIGALTRAALNK